MSMSRMLRRLLADETGQDLVEYALLAALLTIVSVTTLRLLGEALPKVFQDIWQILQPLHRRRAARPPPRASPASHPQRRFRAGSEPLAFQPVESHGSLRRSVRIATAGASPCPLATSLTLPGPA